MNVHAIIVGIEHYDTLLDGVDIELDGPASDAVRFATLLLHRGVPPANLHVFVACLDELSRRAEMDRAPGGAEVPFQSASRDCIETFFDTTLATIDQPAILYVLWGGHGAMRGGQEHHLFYGNMRVRSPFAFNLDARLRQLRSFPNLTTQNVFIDACANYVELSQLGRVAFTDPGPGDPDPGVKQHVLLAAASGQKARNDKIERTGVFSRELFGQIAADPTAWPSAVTLAPKLEEIFLQKGRDDRSFRQRPVMLRFRANDGSGFDLGATPKPDGLQAVALLADCSIAQLDLLSDVLGKSEILNDPLERDALYQLVLGNPKLTRAWRTDGEFDRATLAAWTLHRDKIDDLAKALDAKGDLFFRSIQIALKRVDLARRATRLLDTMALSTKMYLKAFQRIPGLEDSTGYFEDLITLLAGRADLARSPLFRFLLEVSLMVEPEHRAAIDTFLGEAKASSTYLADLRQQIESNRQYRLIVSVKQSPPSVWGLLLESGVAQAPRVIRPFADNNTFLAALQEIYAELLSDFLGDISVELVLPMEQLCHNVETAGIVPVLPIPIPIPATPLSLRYPLVLRWRERILKPGNYQGEIWLGAAKLVSERTTGACTPILGTFPAVQDDSFWKMLEQPKHDLLDLGYQPVPTAMLTLAMALYSGTAYACWRRNPPSPAMSVLDYQNALADLVAGSFSDLPRRAVKMRKNAASQQVALLWDDPESNPATFIRSFEEIK